MKRKHGTFTGIAVLLLAAMFTLAGCDAGNGPTGGNPQTVTYTGVSGGKTYTLKITENTGRYVAQIGDTYLLTVGADASSGTVQTASATNLVLEPTNAPGVLFTVTVAGTNLSTYGRNYNLG
jgi:hypothetical protein